MLVSFGKNTGCYIKYVYHIIFFSKQGRIHWYSLISHSQTLVIRQGRGHLQPYNPLSHTLAVRKEVICTPGPQPATPLLIDKQGLYAPLDLTQPHPPCETQIAQSRLTSFIRFNHLWHHPFVQRNNSTAKNTNKGNCKKSQIFKQRKCDRSYSTEMVVTGNSSWGRWFNLTPSWRKGGSNASRALNLSNPPPPPPSSPLTTLLNSWCEINFLVNLISGSVLT